MKKIKLQSPGLLAVLLYSLMTSHASLADDTEVLIGTAGQAWATPNVLFIFDTSGSMAKSYDCTGRNCPDLADTNSDQKLHIVKDVFSNLMTNNSGINVGLMRFNTGGDGGYFISPMQELNSTTKDTIIGYTDHLSADGDTPLSETLYEAARYYRGMSVDFGTDSVDGVFVNPNANTKRYKSPVNYQCQANYIILLTDGQPHNDTAANDSIASMTGSSCTGNCLDEVAGYLHTVDVSSGGNGIDGDQTVNTYTIGFTTNQTLLQDTADAGGGEYITANNADELSSAFDSIIKTIVNTNNTFSPPAMAANAFDSVSDYNKLYFTLFEPAARPKWDGNVKPYTLSGDPPQLTDANGDVAVDDQGFFKDTSQSLWSSDAFGGNIAEGGANEQLPAADERNLYTFTGTYTNGVPDDNDSSHPTLSDDSNALKIDDPMTSALTYSMLGLTDDTNFDSVVNTIRSSTLGDPLHSKPVLVNYGGTNDAPDLTLFVATNAGFLHALDANTGEEQFAFIPKELLPHLPTLTQGTGGHIYGLDGDVTAWVKDVNHNGIIDDTDDHVYVYVGMRRGGSNYYALDVTDRDAPVLKWVIKGGTGTFSKLGQTWSRPEVTTIKYGDSTRTVLIFGGGYDAITEDNPLHAYGSDTIGNAIYIVDADTGERLWWAGPLGSGANLEMTSMTNSIPSDVRLFDSDQDGNTDRLYVGDMGGHIFRIDLQATDAGVSGSGVLLASLGSSSPVDAANNRRFYYPPDVVLTRQPGKTPYISVNIGSGYRAHPLNPTSDATGTVVNDRFYSLRDSNILGSVPDSYTTITNDDLLPAPATTDLVATQEFIDNLASSDGWYITLTSRGEKVLAPSLTINGEILFTTYTPPESVERTDCSPPPGIGKLYRVSLFDATPITGEDRSTILKRPGIPPEPVVMFRKVTTTTTTDGTGGTGGTGGTDGTGGTNETSVTKVEADECIGTDCKKVPNPTKMEETYWRDDG
jgi:type IV pilus assembly protein PilY1